MITGQKKKISYKKFFIFMGLVFACVLILLFLLNLITPTRSFSEKENRVLSSRPKLSVSAVTSGDYEKDYETYVNDQFFLRDFWVTAKATTDRLLGKTESNGVYLGRKSYLMEKFETPEDSAYSTTMTSIQNFAQKHSDIEQYALIAPTAINVLQKYRPMNAPVDDQNAYLDRLKQDFTNTGITFVDVRDTFSKHIDDGLYYHTDHHWTTQGAYYAFEELAKSFKIDPQQYAYEKLPVSYRFQGTLSAKTGFLSMKKEELDVYLPKDDTIPSCVVNYVEEQKKSTTFYDSAKLSTRDKYALFFGGNHSEVKITSDINNQDTLLIFKDSYANSLVPFLAPHYRTIIMVDPRYYTGDIEKLISSENVTKILYLYNANTMATDTTLNITLDAE